MDSLDFSKYPSIRVDDSFPVPSQSLEKIRDLAENLFSAMNSFISDVLKFDQKIKLLDSREAEIVNKEIELNEKEARVYALEDRLKAEKEYIVNTNIALKVREKKMEGEQKLLEEIEKAKKEWEDKKAEVLRLSNAGK